MPNLPKRRIETKELSPLGMLIGYVFLLMRMVAYTLACRPACPHAGLLACRPAGINQKLEVIRIDIE